MIPTISIATAPWRAIAAYSVLAATVIGSAALAVYAVRSNLQAERLAEFRLYDVQMRSEGRKIRTEWRAQCIEAGGSINETVNFFGTVESLTCQGAKK